ncbi:septum formation initiator family protein [Streptomyces sp. NPDC026672]|uniref:FtsB family cell division protein n=1 Tax=unclassified Streptomyces TaxID=2593676 RepID=UPI0033D9398E
MSRKPELRGRAARLARLFPAGRAKAARTPFVLLVVLLLGGGLIGLLVLNSALSEGSFQLDDLQKQTKNLTDEQQALQRDIDAYSAPDALQRRARELGMVPGGDPAFLGPDGTVKGVPSAAADVRPPRPTVPETITVGPSAPSAPVSPLSASASSASSLPLGVTDPTPSAPLTPSAPVAPAAPPGTTAPLTPAQPATTTTPGR